MRLLHTKKYRLETFFGTSTPRYTILSHTWEKDEVLFGDIQNPDNPLPTHKAGWQKIKDACTCAVKDGYEWIWIDTFCIDKESSAELSEAINSMFKWYRQADICYAYLCDVNKPAAPPITFDQSRWFTRGWTLQELIAPRDVQFYDFTWNQLGTRQGYTGSSSLVDDSSRSFVDAISQRTGIPRLILARNEFGDGRNFRTSGPPGHVPSRSHRFDDGQCLNCYLEDELPSLLEHFSISQRMLWAASRETTRKEDLAYCLLGVFGVNMPLLYGEGERAFIRLQEEIIKVTEDQSILAFKGSDSSGLRRNRPLLAASPNYFEKPGIVRLRHSTPSPMNITAKTIELSLVLFPCRYEHQGMYRSLRGTSLRSRYLAVLDCAYVSDMASRPSIVVEELDQTSRTFTRVDDYLMIPVGPQTVAKDLFNMEEEEEEPLGQNWHIWKASYECDLKDARTEVVRLLLKPAQEHSPYDLLSHRDPALNIQLSGDLKCRYSYPTRLHSTATYIPSVVLVSDDPNRGLTVTSGIRPCGLICFQAVEGKHLFIEWGIRAFPNTNPNTQANEYTGWCKFLDWHEVITYRWETGKLEEGEFEKAAKGYLMARMTDISAPEWAAKEWPVYGIDANGYEFRTPRLRKCVVGMENVEFLGQKHLKMQVDFS